MSTHSQPAPDQLWRGIKWSLAAHVVLLIAVIFQNIFFPSEFKPYVPTLRVDIVGLPDVLKKDLHKISRETEAKVQEQAPKPPEPKVVEPPSDPKEMVLNPKPKKENTKERAEKMNTALARIKALSKITDEEASEVKEIKGNVASKGTTLTGEAKEAAETTYFDLIHDKLRSNWALPVWLSRQNHSAQVLIYLDARGRLQNMVFKKSSGNAQFDNAVQRTVTNSHPFPPPPPELRDSVRAHGILLGFPL